MIINLFGQDTELSDDEVRRALEATILSLKEYYVAHPLDEDEVASSEMDVLFGKICGIPWFVRIIDRLADEHFAKQEE